VRLHVSSLHGFTRELSRSARWLQKLGVLSSKACSLGEIHHWLAEINQCKSIKRTELSSIPSVQSDSRTGGPYENQIL
jgi:hypothetical protein